MGVHRAPRTRRIPPLLAPLLVVLAVVSSTPASAAPGSYLRLAQLTPTQPGTELVVSSVSNPSRSVSVFGVDYGFLTPYRRIEPGDYVVGLRAAGSSAPPRIGTTLDVMGGSAYTVGVVGSGEVGATVLVDDLGTPAAGRARMRVIDATTSEVPLDVRGPGGAPIADGLASGTAGAYRPVPAGPMLLEVRQGTAPATRLPVTVGPNQVVSVVLVSGSGAVQARVHVDSAGPAAVPPGPVDAGYGGTAADGTPGRGPAGAVVLAVLAAAALVLSLRSGRRRAAAARPPSC